MVEMVFVGLSLIVIEGGEFPIIGRQGALCGNVNLAIGEFYATEHAVIVDRFSNTDLMWAYNTFHLDSR